MAATATLKPSPEHRRVAAQNHERARQVIQKGDYPYGIELLRTSCRLDPGNLIYRKTLRLAQRKKYESSLFSKWLTWLTTMPAKFRLRMAGVSRKPGDVLDYGERVLSRNPWDLQTHMVMAVAARDLGLLDVGVWILEHARQKHAANVRLNRLLAELYEKRGNYANAIAMWDLVSHANPQDLEAAQKAKDLSAMQTIDKGQYEQVTQGTVSSQVLRDSDWATGKSAAKIASSSAELRSLKASERLEAKITAEPTLVNPYLQLAKIYEEAAKLTEARDLLQQGLAATGQNFDLLMALADLDVEPFRQNLRVAEQKLKVQPQDEELKRKKAELQKEINSREMEIYRQRADRFPTELGPRLELGIRLLRANQIDAAIQELQQSRRDPRSRWRSLLYLGHAFKAKKNWPLAKRNFEEALQALPASEDDVRKQLLYHLAVGAAAERDWTLAQELGNELANLDYGYRDIGKLLDEWGKQTSAADK